MFIKNIIFSLAFYFTFAFCTAQTSSKIFSQKQNSWVDSVMTSMNDSERIAQLFMVAAYSNKGDSHEKKIKELIEQNHIGGVMFLQGSPYRQARITNDLQKASKIPLLIAIDAEWGIDMRLDSSLRFPWQMTLGAIKDPDLIYQMGEEVARQCKLLGIHMNFAPVVDVNSNPKNPIINNRSFGEDPNRVAVLGASYMRGMQDNKILACAKHFPGHGDTEEDSHKTLPIIRHSRYRLSQTELVPFKRLIQEGVSSIMVAHLEIPSLDTTKNLAATLSSKVVNKLLKDELNFNGLVITDALNMKGVSDYYSSGELELKALLAGNDILLFPEDVPKAILEIKRAVKEKKISQEYIDQKCKKILQAKYWVGLNKYQPISLNEITDNNITPQAEALNRELISSSITLLQNYENLIPLKRLDTLKIASVSIGESGDAFQDMLNNYTKVDNFQIKETSNQKEQAIILDQLVNYNLVIVSIHKSNKNAWKDFRINRNIDIFLQSLAMQNKVIVNVFANPYSINSFLFTDNFDALLLGYQNSYQSQELAAQALFGGISIKGKIPVTTHHYKLWSGIETKRCRFSYVIPEQLNIDVSKFYKIDSLVNHALKEKAIPGCQVLIAKDQHIFFNKSYGHHTYQKNRKVINSDVYDLASITKIVSTIPSLMRLTDLRKFDLDKPLGDYMSIEGTNKEKLINRQILAHQAGFKPWIPFYKKTLEESESGTFILRDTLYSKNKSEIFPHRVAEEVYLHFSYPDTIIKEIIDSDLLRKKDYKYSDLGYYLYKKIIEDISKKRIDQHVNDEFYKKLGMENLGYLPLRRLDRSRIVPTENDFEFRGQLLQGDVHDMGAAMQAGIGGHAGVFSNANDLAKIMQMYLNNGEYAGERYISSNSIRDFTKCQFCLKKNRRGAGFDKPSFPDQEGGSASSNVSLKSFGHSGFTGTLAWADPQTQVVYVFLSNRIHPDSTNKKLQDLNIRTEIMKVIFDTFNE